MKQKLLNRDDVLNYTGVDDRSNLKWILFDYLTLALIVIPAVTFIENRAVWGFSLYWNIPVAMIVVVLVGAVQHRLACLGHEAAHYTLLNNRFWNEAVSDLFCIYPVFATTQAYRVHHIGHHLYPNDWERDPNLLNGGQTKHFDRFPMEKKDFVFLYFLRFFWPPYLLRHLWDRAASRQNPPAFSNPVIGIRFAPSMGVCLRRPRCHSSQVRVCRTVLKYHPYQL